RERPAAARVSRRPPARGHVIGEALLDRQHRIADLEVRISELEAARIAERERADRAADAAPDVSELLRERDALRAQVGRLAEELTATRFQRDRAEERCGLLERQLEAMEKVQRGDGLPPLVPPAAGPVTRSLPKVLIVDDQRDNLMAMKAVLSTLSQELVAVGGGGGAGPGGLEPRNGCHRPGGGAAGGAPLTTTGGGRGGGGGAFGAPPPPAFRLSRRT
ncbi:hypothetical protein ACFW15_33765, partial [Streptomyces sp. NPDC058953]